MNRERPSFLLQGLGMCLYFYLHLTQFSQISAVTLKWGEGHVLEVLLDDIIAIGSMVAFYRYKEGKRIREGKSGDSKGFVDESASGNESESDVDVIRSKSGNRRWSVPWSKPTLSPENGLVITLTIFLLYQWTGYLYPALNSLLNILSQSYPSIFNAVVRRNMVVLCMHSCWILTSSLVLTGIRGFFDKSVTRNVDMALQQGLEGGNERERDEATDQREDVDGSGDRSNMTNVSYYDHYDLPTRSFHPSFRLPTHATIGTSNWFTFSTSRGWLAWTVGGYAISQSLFRAVDFLNLKLLPSTCFDKSNIVGTILSPTAGENSLLALMLGSIAPCLTAPLWEEVFYRGYLYPYLSTLLPMPLATLAQALLFAAHHGQINALLPLMALGGLWSLVYIHSGNLMTVIMIHGLWNSRIFVNGMKAFL